ncbi:RdgB/HAM1 family non-canonical purine NTP pyrophosphatase [candidate division WOR-3 bacterium]|uniref:dITP/XTP pyrophosphatase n=1 Tax=candidate division WOR-3 bacterium TaxID=2052148 RepID=A0A9D5QF43_UNCW3|nr:RdgB/HAM1 family non-canonical purine NTP pyrophosphatase [candidate division WOR-3 bacterium]MBD3365655.1 RdgB/HAM1 family non-canonical purine NTP pyrophosphatase [candidate division WOR-3 bacterium]
MTLRRLLVATGNRGKLCEFKAVLDGIVEIVCPDEAGLEFKDVEEGVDYAENARMKAEVYRKQFNDLICGEDSGLEIDALEGRPGPLSARYGGEEMPHREKCKMILAELADIPMYERTARFRATIALIDSGRVETFEGVLEGWIGFEYRGDKGFGYDPIFIPRGFSRTNAELGMIVKNRISHRAKAIRKLAEYLKGKTSITTKGTKFPEKRQ